MPRRGGLGVFVGYVFGPREGFEWGFEAFASKVDDGNRTCENLPRSHIGGLVQFAMIGLRDPRFTFAAFGGKELEREGMMIGGEFGGTYRFGSEPGPGIHLGLTPGYSILNAYGRVELLLEDYSVGAGLRVPPAFGNSSFCVVGRPLRGPCGPVRIDGRARRLARRRSHRTTSSPTGALAARAWERDAQYECASVPAFLQLAEVLLACGAPDALVARALAAACDEIVHARTCAAIATRCSSEEIWPTVPPLPRRGSITRRAGLLQLATESWIDGCLGEGAAARQAERSAELGTENAIRIAQRRIARDERRHADLAWQVLEWSIHEGGQVIREAVRALRDVEPLPASPVDAPAGLELHGRLPAREIDVAIEKNAHESRRRLDDLMAQN